MAKFLRFTQDQINSGTKSFNGFTGEELKGICCFEINEEESVYVQIRRIGDANSNYVRNSNGHYVLFEGDFIEENFNKEGVIAIYKEIVDIGELYATEYGYSIK